MTQTSRPPLVIQTVIFLAQCIVRCKYPFYFILHIFELCCRTCNGVTFPNTNWLLPNSRSSNMRTRTFLVVFRSHYTTQFSYFIQQLQHGIHNFGCLCVRLGWVIAQGSWSLVGHVVNIFVFHYPHCHTHTGAFF